MLPFRITEVAVKAIDHMLDTTLVPKEALYLLADHLDAALAAGEDLLASHLAAIADLDTTENSTDDSLAQFVARLERLEASFMGRVLHARRRLDELPHNDIELKPVSNLFFSSTGLLLELVSRSKRQSENQFDVGGDRLPFLRDRGLLARDAAGRPHYAPVIVTEAYRVGGLLELGPLMDMVAGLLDLLDRRYDLYADAERTTPAIDAHEKGGAAGEAHRDSLALNSADTERAVSRRTEPHNRPATPVGMEPVSFDASALTPASLMEALREIEQTSAETMPTARPPLQ